MSSIYHLDGTGHSLSCSMRCLLYGGNEFLGTKVETGEVQTGYKENFLPTRTVKKGKRLPKVVMQSPASEVFKACLYKNLE